MIAVEPQTGIDTSRGIRIITNFGRGTFMLAMIIPAIIFLLLFGALSCLHTEEVAEFTGGPRIHFEKEIVDLGKASPGQELYIEFHFRNIGDTPLIINEIATEALVEGC
jgi:hypothetical protein